MKIEIKQHLFCKFMRSVSDGLVWEGEVLQVRVDPGELQSPKEIQKN